MSRTAQGTVTTGLSLLSLLVVSNVCYFLLFPIAAWTHNVVLLVLSVVVPFVLVQIVKAKKGIVATPKKRSSSSTINGILITVIMGTILWLHLWLVAILFIVILIIRGNAKKRR